MSEAQTRAGFVAIVGAPNAGKSTLVNAQGADDAHARDRHRHGRFGRW